MGDDNWDISAVVRNCNINKPNNVVAPNLGMETSENDDWNFFDRLLSADMNDFNGLSEIFSIDFSVADQEKLDDQFIIMNQNDNQQLYLHPIQPAQSSGQISFPPSPTTIACVPQTTTTSKEWIDLQQQQLEIGANVYPDITFPISTPLIQTSIRKNQPVRIIHELLPEELIDDTWVWHKYGQKHIKGSTFPRNYFKCSTSILCEAKKTIEKSPKDENIFLVSYSGEHNHNPPTNRRYFVGWNNSSKFKIPKGINIMPRELSLNVSSSSSKRAKRSKFDDSPVSPTMPTLEIESKNKMVIVAVENKGGGGKEENVNEDIITNFEELQGVNASI